MNKITFSLIFTLISSNTMAFEKASFFKAPVFFTPAESLQISYKDDLSLDEKGNPIKKFLISNSNSDAYFRLNSSLRTRNILVSCDGKSKGKFKLIKGKKYNIKMAKDINECKLILSKNKGIKLIKDEVSFPFLKSLNSKKENCTYINKDVEGIDNVFLSNKYFQMSCANAVSEEISVLNDSKDALLVKIESLLGTKLSDAFIDNQNPYAELDFSKAPKLDAIFVSTLLYRHDFTGVVLGRLLKFHAKRGTLVNIIGTGYMHNEKDKSLLNELVKFSDNIRVQEYKYHESNLLKKAKVLTNYLRDMHVKMFVTLSKTNPNNNVIIMGGRNVHDGFVFSEKTDFSKYPKLNQTDPEAPYAYWKDLEIKVVSRDLALSVYSHLLKFWNREISTQKTADIRSNKKETPQNLIFSDKEAMVRHFISLPFNDEMALEKLYIEMIDNAQHKIRLSSPYLRPTEGIFKALERAINRNKNMDIVIQTRINLEGDTAAWLYEETNKGAINKLFDKVKIYEWTQNSILHTKLLTIDDDFVFIGSVNLSQRSFIQDIESGFLVKSKSFSEAMNQLFDSYNDRSKLIESEQKRRFFGRVISDILKKQF